METSNKSTATTAVPSGKATGAMVLSIIGLVLAVLNMAAGAVLAVL